MLPIFASDLLSDANGEDHGDDERSDFDITRESEQPTNDIEPLWDEFAYELGDANPSTHSCFRTNGEG